MSDKLQGGIKDTTDTPSTYRVIYDYGEVREPNDTSDLKVEQDTTDER